MKTAPFTLNIPEEDVTDLRRRLRTTRWADDFSNEDWRYGVELGWLREMVDYWADEFDWRAREADINRLPQFRTEIDGTPIHFIHVRGKGPNPKPIILSHGWPWTFWDWKDVISALADPAAHGGSEKDAFDVVVPSLPGFGFSVPLRKPDIGPRETSGLWVKLMQGLGYPRFAAAGGDFGAFITADLGHLYPEAVSGIYLTMAIAPGLIPRLPFPVDAFALEEAELGLQGIAAGPTVTSHLATHVADSQTLAYAMTDSPVGTAAWIWQRRRAWSDCGGDLIGLHGRDFLCTTASIYWFNKSLASSFRYYVAHFRQPWIAVYDRLPTIAVPTGIGVSPKDVVMVPRAIMEERCNVQRYTVFDRGGHFTPSESPEPLAAELRAFFGSLT